MESFLLVLIILAVIAFGLIAFQIGYTLGLRDGWQRGWMSGKRFGDLKVLERDAQNYRN